MLPLSPQAQAAVEARAQRRRNEQGRQALQHLRRAQEYRRRVRAAREAAEHAARTGAHLEQPVTPRQAYHAGHTTLVHQHVHQHPGCTTQQVVHATGLTLGQATNILDRLRKQGLVDRDLRTDGGGRRAHWHTVDGAQP